MESAPNMTRLLREFASGEQEQVNGLMSALYDDLRIVAERFMQHEPRDHTLQPTALVHEAYMRLIDQRQVQWRDRAHFLAVASQVIRRILVDHARRRNAAKRGGRDRPAILMESSLATPTKQIVDVVALDEAMNTLNRISEVQARVVELRYFGGLTVEECAEVLGIGRRSVDREWACAKAWLYRELGEPDQAAGS